ncbi:MAG: hypothetical protein SV375_18410, partial [Thermodesulfobacteriota bacterium]|nr:hypothetical protein [Thermodesulfobacteriota bacterium]
AQTSRFYLIILNPSVKRLWIEHRVSSQAVRLAGCQSPPKRQPISLIHLIFPMTNAVFFTTFIANIYYGGIRGILFTVKEIPKNEKNKNSRQ